MSACGYSPIRSRRPTCPSCIRGIRRSGRLCLKWVLSCTKCGQCRVQPVVRGNRLKSPSSGLYALHAKAFVFDRQRVFVGSMNLDQRSLHLNTEIGLIIDSPELARQIALRFADIAQPANSYVPNARAGPME